MSHLPDGVADKLGALRQAGADAEAGQVAGLQLKAQELIERDHLFDDLAEQFDIELLV